MIFWCILLLFFSSGASAQTETPESSSAEAEEKATDYSDVPEGLESIRVLKEDAGEVVTQAMNFVRSSKALSWWSADVFGKKGYVRILGCNGEDTSPNCFEIRLDDPSETCVGTLAGNWCVSFPSAPIDAWAQKKLLLHPNLKAELVDGAWSDAIQEDKYTQDIILGAFKGTSEAWSVAAKPGRILDEEDSEGEEVTQFFFRGADTATEVQILLEGFLALLLFGFALRKVNGDDWKTTLAWLGVTGGALALRAVLGENALFHENHHGFRYLAAILSGDGQTFGVPSSYITLMHPLAILSGGNDGGIFFWNMLFSALCAPLLGLLVRDLSGKASAGWLAAIMWAITPHSIRVASSEIYFNFSAFMLLAASLASIRAFRALGNDKVETSHRFVLFALATFLVALSAKVRVLTLAYPAVILLLVLSAGLLKSRFQKKMALVLGAVVGTFMIPQVVALVAAIADQPERSSGLVSPLCVVTNGGDYIFFDASIVSPSLLFFVALGCLALLMGRFIKKRREAVFLVTAVGAVVALAGFVCGVEVSRIRFEVPAHALLTGIAALGIVWLLELVQKKSHLLAQAFGVLCVVSIAFPWVFLNRPFQDPMEFSFMVEQVVPSIRGGATSDTYLIQPTNIAEEFGEVGASWWERRLPGVDVIDRVANIPEIEEAEPEKIYAYIGLECFWAVPGFEAIPYPKADHVGGVRIHPVCAASLAGAEWTPVVMLEMRREETVGSCVDIREDTVVIGLFEGRRL